MKVRMRRDLTSGITLSIITVILWMMIPYHIVVSESNSDAQMFPRLVVGFMFVISIYIAVKSIVTKKDEVLEFDLRKEGKILLYVVALILYVFLIEKLGYMAATFFISAVTLMVYRTKRNVYLAMAVFIVIVYFLFTLALGVPLP